MEGVIPGTDGILDLTTLLRTQNAPPDGLWAAYQFMKSSRH